MHTGRRRLRPNRRFLPSPRVAFLHGLYVAQPPTRRHSPKVPVAALRRRPVLVRRVFRLFIVVSPATLYWCYRIRVR